MDWPTAISTAAAVIVAIVVPMFAYILKAKDETFRDLEAELRDSGKTIQSQQVAITKLEGQAQVWGIVHGDLRELREVMVQRQEWAEQMNFIRSELRELRSSLRPGSGGAYRGIASEREMPAVRKRDETR